jgi:hypothetical protein
MSIGDFGRGVDQVYQIYSGVLAAERTGREDIARERLIDGLGISCVLFQELLNSLTIGAPKVRPDAWKGFLQLMKDGRYESFLKEENELLRRAGVSNEVSDEIVVETDRILQQIASEKTIIKDDWPRRLASLGDEVCDAAKRASFDQQKRQLLGHAKKALAGGLLASAGSPFAGIGHLFVAAGVSLIQSALDAFGDAG